METVLVTGGTGLVSRHLCSKLQERGYDVAILSRTRKPEAAFRVYTWNPEKGEIEKEALERAGCIIHLAGANIAEKRWTAQRKQLIIDSRVQTAQLLFRKVREKNSVLQTFITASAVGYYGMITSKKIFAEEDPPAPDFLGETCNQWEQEAGQFNGLGIRTVKIRTGVVLASEGGALSKMIMPVKMGMGSAIGTGKQYLPWIHIDDLCNIYIKAIEDKKMTGPFNAVAPEYTTNQVFMRTLARVLKKPFWLPNVPAPALQLLFGEMSGILLKGSRVSAEKIQKAGYEFLFPGLETALNDLIKRKRR